MIRWPILNGTVIKNYGFMRLTCLLFLWIGTSAVSAQDTLISLWPSDKIPNRIATGEKEIHKEEGILLISKVQEPTIEVYLPAQRNATGKAVLIFPGGGYHVLAYDWEGTDIAKFLNGKGIAGIVVKYRLPTSNSLRDPWNVPLIDAQRAMRMVRSNAKKWNIKEDQIGIIGFSAGGHLAATLGTHYNENGYEPIDAIDTVSARPDFMALIYPVITFTRTAKHSGSEKALLGDKSDPELEKYFSNELMITSSTPPTFLVHAADDTAVPVENSLLFFQGLKDKNIPATMHIYPKGGHGFSLARNDVHLRGWTERLFEWIETME